MSGEEPGAQIALRAQRLGLIGNKDSAVADLGLLAEIQLEKIQVTIDE